MANTYPCAGASVYCAGWKPALHLVLHGFDGGDSVGEFGFFADTNNHIGDRQAVQLGEVKGNDPNVPPAQDDIISINLHPQVVTVDGVVGF